jgi:hypothetical protein
LLARGGGRTGHDRVCRAAARRERKAAKAPKANADAIADTDANADTGESC